MSAERHTARAARPLARMTEDDPALAALALWCRHRDRDDLPVPAESDARTIWYGPRFDALTLAEQVGLCAHHVLHIALRHAGRSQAMRDRLGERFDRDVFNIAADALVNESLLLAGHVLPRPCLLVTDLLKARRGEMLTAEDAVGRYDAERLYLALLERPGGLGDEAGRRRSFEDRTQQAQATRDHAAGRGYAPDLTEDETAEAPDESDGDWQQHLARAMQAGRASGRGIGVIGHRLADLPVRTTPWEVHLRGLIERAVSEGPRRDAGRPARRWLAADSAARGLGQPTPPFEPGWQRRRVAPRIAVALDCSGSIDDARLALFAAEVAGVARRTGAEIAVLPFDTEVRATLRPRAGEAAQAIRQAAFARGGGTDFAPVLEAAVALDPAIIVVLTDLDGKAGKPPRVPVLWAVPADTAPKPPFGRVLCLSG